MVRRASCFVFIALLSACGGSNAPSGGGPSGTPTTPTPTANRNPAISQLTVSPSFGVSQLSAFSMQADASDPDGDSLTYEWQFSDGTTASGSSVSSKVFGGPGGGISVRLNVTDGKGGSTTDSRDIMIGCMTGRWIANVQDFSRLQLDLQQSGGVVTGRFTQMDPLPQTPVGTSGVTDPAEPGKIDREGHVEIRMKVGRFLDFYIRGEMGATGRTISGGLFGSGFNGTPVTIVKQ